MKGKFITIEGTDGAGKSTQINLLKEHLEKKGYHVLFTREPGGTPLGEKIRALLLDTENTAMRAHTEILLYAASRAQHLEEKILPAIEEGKIVLCDRFTDSSIAYQGFGRSLGHEMIASVNLLATQGVQPDLTLYFDIPPKEGLLRKKKERTLDRMEQESLSFHEKVYEGYQYLTKQYPDRIKKIDARPSIKTVHEQVLQAVLPILP